MTSRGRRRILFVMVAAWLAGTYLTWRSTVPAVATTVTPRAGRLVRVHGGPDEPITLFGFHQTDQRLPRGTSTGPVELLDAESGRIVHRALTEDDELLTDRWPAVDRIVVRRGTTIRFVDLVHDRTLAEFEQPAMFRRAELANEGRLVLIQTGSTLWAYDATTGEPKWSRPLTILSAASDVWSRQWCWRWKVIRVRTVKPEQPDALVGPSDPWELLDPETGRPLDWFHDLGLVQNVMSSPCSRYLLITDAGSIGAVYDAATGKRLWKVGSITGWLKHAYRFSDDGDELELPYVFGESRVGLARYAARDGTVLADWPKGTQPTSLSSTERPGRYAIRHVATMEGRLHRLWYDLLRRCKVVLYHVPDQTPKTVVIDQTTDSVIASLPAPASKGWLSYDGDRSGFAVIDGEAVSWYRFPPDRDWAWLIRWGLFPPAGLLLFLSVVGQIRRDHRSAAASAAFRDPAAGAHDA